MATIASCRSSGHLVWNHISHRVSRAIDYPICASRRKGDVCTDDNTAFAPTLSPTQDDPMKLHSSQSSAPAQADPRLKDTKNKKASAERADRRESSFEALLQKEPARAGLKEQDAKHPRDGDAHRAEEVATEAAFEGLMDEHSERSIEVRDAFTTREHDRHHDRLVEHRDQDIERHTEHVGERVDQDRAPLWSDTEREEAPAEIAVEAAPLIEQEAPVERAKAEPLTPRDRTDLDQIAKQMVQACHVGEDARARRVALLDIHVPGRGQVRVRMRQGMHGVEVRMRASDDALRSLLSARRDQLRHGAADRGVVFSTIEVV